MHGDRKTCACSFKSTSDSFAGEFLEVVEQEPLQRCLLRPRTKIKAPKTVTYRRCRNFGATLDSTRGISPRPEVVRIDRLTTCVVIMCRRCCRYVVGSAVQCRSVVVLSSLPQCLSLPPCWLGGACFHVYISPVSVEYVVSGTDRQWQQAMVFCSGCIKRSFGTYMQCRH